MTKLRVFLGAILAVYLFELAWTFSVVGFGGVLSAMIQDPVSRIMAFELGIAFTIVGYGMWHDARERGRSALPYLVLTAVAGPVGPLLYLIRRDVEPRTGAEPLRQPA